MKKFFKFLFILAILAGAAYGGYWYGKKSVVSEKIAVKEEEEEKETMPEKPKEYITRSVYAIYENPIDKSEENKFTGAISIYSSDVDGKNAKVLAKIERKDKKTISGKISPDGKILAYVTGLSEDANEFFLGDALGILDLNKGTQTELVSATEGVMKNFVWSPDSKQIVYTKVIAGKPQTVILDIETNEEEILIKESGIVYLPLSWGKNIIYLNKSIYQSEISFGEIYSIKEDGSDLKNVASVTEATEFPVFTADHKYFLITAKSDANIYKIILFDLTTNTQKIVRSSTTEIYNRPLWLVDGEELVYGASSGIWKADINGENREQLVETAGFTGKIEDVESLYPVSISFDKKYIIIYSDILFPQIGRVTAHRYIDLDKKVVKILTGENQKGDFYGWGMIEK